MNDYIRAAVPDGSGNSSSEKNYQFTETTPLSGRNMYRLKQIDSDGKFTYSPLVKTGSIISPDKFNLFQNYPNPFNPETTIKFGLPDQARVKLELFSITGERIAVILDEMLKAGYHSVKLSTSEFELSSGIYFYRITAVNRKESIREMKKLTILK